MHCSSGCYSHAPPTHTSRIGVNRGDLINEYEILKDIYESANGDAWDDNTHWDMSLQGAAINNGNIERFEGVALIGTDRRYHGCYSHAKNDCCIQSIDLQGNNLTGSLPESLGDFKPRHFFKIWLNDNKLTGAFPSSLLKNANLDYLFLHNNQLTGPLPSDLGNHGMSRLEIRHNNFTGEIPGSVIDGRKRWAYLSWGGQPLCLPLPDNLSDDQAIVDWINTNLGHGFSISGGGPTCVRWRKEHPDTVLVQHRAVEFVLPEAEADSLIFLVIYHRVHSRDDNIKYSMSALPPGLHYDPVSRQISGTPTEISVRQPYEHVARESSREKVGTVYIAVIGDVVLDPIPNYEFVLNEPVGLPSEIGVRLPSAQGGRPSYAYDLSPQDSLPEGVEFTELEGENWLTGTPVEAMGPRVFTYTVTEYDGKGFQGSKTFTVAVRDPVLSSVRLSNYPNPFNLQTTISFTLDKSGEVRIAVYDILGREAAVLVNESKAAGRHEVHLDGSDLSGGMYFYRLQAPEEGLDLVRAMTVVR